MKIREGEGIVDHLSLLPDCGSNVVNLLILLPYDGLRPQTVNQSKPFPKLLLLDILSQQRVINAHRHLIFSPGYFLLCLACLFKRHLVLFFGSSPTKYICLFVFSYLFSNEREKERMWIWLGEEGGGGGSGRNWRGETMIRI